MEKKEKNEKKRKTEKKKKKNLPSSGIVPSTEVKSNFHGRKFGCTKYLKIVSPTSCISLNTHFGYRHYIYEYAYNLISGPKTQSPASLDINLRK